MNGATFRLFCETMGVTTNEAARALGVNPRTVNRWESGALELPDDVQQWMRERWDNFVNVIDMFLEAVEEMPEGTNFELYTYKSEESLARAGSTLTLEQANARNRALAISLALENLPVTAVSVQEEP